MATSSTIFFFKRCHLISLGVEQDAKVPRSAANNPGCPCVSTMIHLPKFVLKLNCVQQARTEAEFGAALVGERLQRDGELTEIKSVVDEMMNLDASASGGGVAGKEGLSSPPHGRSSLDNTTIDPVGQISTSSRVGVGNCNDSAGVGVTARLREAWSLLEASEAARRKLQDEVKAWADKVTQLEEALATAEAAVEEGAREARLLAASLQDARRGLAYEEAARKQAEDRADALR